MGEDALTMGLYNHGYSPDKVLRLDYGDGNSYDAIELGDESLYVKIDPTETTWFGMSYMEACMVLQNHVYGLQTTPKEFAEEMQNIRNAFNGDKERVHMCMDECMMELLVKLGYEEGVAIFDDTPVWYA